MASGKVEREYYHMAASIGKSEVHHSYCSALVGPLIDVSQEEIASE